MKPSGDGPKINGRNDGSLQRTHGVAPNSVVSMAGLRYKRYLTEQHEQDQKKWSEEGWVIVDTADVCFHHTSSGIGL